MQFIHYATTVCTLNMQVTTSRVLHCSYLKSRLGPHCTNVICRLGGPQVLSPRATTGLRARLWAGLHYYMRLSPTSLTTATPYLQAYRLVTHKGCSQFKMLLHSACQNMTAFNLFYMIFCIGCQLENV